MNTKSVKKIGILLVIVGLIFIQILNPRVSATSFDLNNLIGNELGNQIGDGNVTVEDGNTTGNNVTTNNITTNNAVTNNISGNTTGNNTTLPKTGTSENVLITLMIICAISGVYTYRKVKEYNM